MEVGCRVQTQYQRQTGCSATGQRKLVSLYRSDCSEKNASSGGIGSSGRAAEKEAGPSFACGKVREGSIEAMICADEELSALDLKLYRVFGTASRLALKEHPPMLRAEKRGWLRGRNECWKSTDRHKCVKDEYVRRIAEKRPLPGALVHRK